MKYIYIAILRQYGLEGERHIEYPIEEYHVPVCDHEPTDDERIHTLVFKKRSVISDMTDNIKEVRTVKIAYNYDRKG